MKHVLSRQGSSLPMPPLRRFWRGTVYQPLDAKVQAVKDLNNECRELGGTRTAALGLMPSGALAGH